MRLNKNEWCFCEFKLQQITETTEGRITSVSDGNFSLGSYDLTDKCFPITMCIKVISDRVAYWSDQFHKLKISSLNYPDLNRELIRRWVEVCHNSENTKIVQERLSALDEFGKTVLDRLHNAKQESVEGVRLFR